MLLPQSAAFAALKNRLNSVSAIGYLHIPTQQKSYQSPTSSSLAAPVPPRPTSEASNRSGASSGTFNSDRPTRKATTREIDANIKWPELLEKFKTIQEKARKARQGRPLYNDDDERPAVSAKALAEAAATERAPPLQPREIARPQSNLAGQMRPPPAPKGAAAKDDSKHRLGDFGRMARGVTQRRDKAPESNSRR